MNNNIKLRSATWIMENIEKKYGVTINDEDIIDDLHRYNKIKNLLSRAPEQIDEYTFRFLNIRCAEYNTKKFAYSPEVIKEIRSAFSNLLFCIINNPNIKHDKYDKEIVQRINKQTYILPLALINKGFKLSVSANAENKYTGLCFFPNGITRDIIVDAANNQFIYYENNESIVGDVFDFLIKTNPQIKFTSAIENIAKMIDYKLPNYLKTNENAEIIKKYKLNLISDIYYKLINESFEKTALEHPEMNDSEIMKVYRFR